MNSPTEKDPLQQQQQQPFSKGAPVEVSSDEEGFRGAWYLATILEMPPKSASKKRKKAFVRYKTLLADDGKSPLTEHVDPGYIRPLPPNEKGNAQSGFEVNDVVDARYRDGWWTGVVRKVLEKSKYRVYFDNPPDVIEFDRKDLRVHWDWIDGNWVRPEKQVWSEVFIFFIFSFIWKFGGGGYFGVESRTFSGVNFLPVLNLRISLHVAFCTENLLFKLCFHDCF